MMLSMEKKDETIAVAMAKFLIIDDHPLFREALHNALELAYPDADTVDAPSVQQATEILGNDSGFDLALLDLNIPGIRGMEGLMTLRSSFPRLPVVVVSGHEDPRIISQVMTCGAAGFIPKSSKKADLADAIRQVMEGSIFLPANYEKPEILPTQEEEEEMTQRFLSLTPQQARVLGMLRDGLLNKQIAFELSVSETTVKAHVSEILRKLNVVSRTQAVIEMQKLENAGVLNLDDPFGEHTSAH